MLSVFRYLLFERRQLRHQVGSLTAALTKEQERNRQREDELTSRILTLAGTFGLQARKAPVEPGTQPHITEQPLTGFEEAHLDALRQAAVEAGRPAEDGDRVFYERRAGRLQG